MNLKNVSTHLRWCTMYLSPGIWNFHSVICISRCRLSVKDYLDTNFRRYHMPTQNYFIFLPLGLTSKIFYFRILLFVIYFQITRLLSVIIELTSPAGLSVAEIPVKKFLTFGYRYRLPLSRFRKSKEKNRKYWNCKNFEQKLQIW